MAQVIVRNIEIELKTEQKQRAAEVFADKSQRGVGTEVVGQFFDNKVSHVRIHLLGEWSMEAKSLISIEKSAYFDYEVTDSIIRK